MYIVVDSHVTVATRHVVFQDICCNQHMIGNYCAEYEHIFEFSRFYSINNFTGDD